MAVSKGVGHKNAVKLKKRFSGVQHAFFSSHISIRSSSLPGLSLHFFQVPSIDPPLLSNFYSSQVYLTVSLCLK